MKKRAWWKKRKRRKKSIEDETHRAVRQFQKYPIGRKGLLLGLCELQCESHASLSSLAHCSQNPMEATMKKVRWWYRKRATMTTLNS